MNMAKICPSGLIFVPSKDGLSHNPNEYTRMEDIEKGIIVLEKAVLHWAKVSSIQNKKSTIARVTHS